MSYDLYMSERVAGVRSGAEGDERSVSTPRDQSRRSDSPHRDLERIVTVVARGRSDWSRFEGGRFIELTSMGDVPLQITIREDGADLSVPYGLTGRQLRAGIENLLASVSRIQRETGWVAFDPQIGRTVDPRADGITIQRAYGAATAGIKSDLLDI